MILDFTTTAVARPKIVNQTFKSFSRNLKGVDFGSSRLFINIDPLPSDVDRQEVIDVAEKYFGTVVANCPKKGNYTTAYNWVWGRAETEFIFNLEDDWAMTEEVHIDKLLAYFDGSETMYEVALRAYEYPYRTCPTSPSVMHERYYKKIAGNLDPTFNPECQLRGRKWGLKMPSKDPKVTHKGRVIAYPEKRSHIVLKDLGRDWMNKQPFKRPNSKKAFTTWQEK